MLTAAKGRVVVPVFILDPETEALGAAAKWRLGLSVAAFAESLREIGLRVDISARAGVGGADRSGG